MSEGEASKSQGLPAIALMLELLAFVPAYLLAGMRLAPITSFFGLEMPYCWYAMYGMFVGQIALVVTAVWFALRGWKSSPLASGCALVLAIFWFATHIRLLVPPPR